MATHRLPEPDDVADEPHGLSKQYRTGGFGHPATDDSEPTVIILGAHRLNCTNCGRPHTGEDVWCDRCSGKSTFNKAAWLRSHIKTQRQTAAFCRANGGDAVWHEQRARELELELEHELESRR